MPNEKTAAEKVAAAQEAVAPRAAQLVQDAATILEEELATGIGAARSLHERMFAEGGASTEDPNEVVQRLRRDAHDAVDVAADLLTSVLTSLTTAAQNASAAGGAAPAGQGAAAAAKPASKPKARAKPNARAKADARAKPKRAGSSTSARK